MKNIFKFKYGWRFTPFAFNALLLRAQPLIYWFRSLKVMIFCKGNVGAKTVIEKDVLFTPRSNIEIGNKVFIGRRSIFEVGTNNDVKLTIGNETWISHDFHLQGMNTLKIGSKVLIGEFVSVRDTNHNFKDPLQHVKDQGDTFGHIKIEDGVWIGRGCLILGKPETTIIGKDSIIAANSTVIHSIPPNTVWGGSPAKFIKER